MAKEIDKRAKNLWQNEQDIMINQILITVIGRGKLIKFQFPTSYDHI